MDPTLNTFSDKLSVHSMKLDLVILLMAMFSACLAENSMAVSGFKFRKILVCTGLPVSLHCTNRLGNLAVKVFCQPG